MADDLFQLLRDDMKDGFKGIHDRLDQMNGRLRDTEQDIAVLSDRNGRKAAIWGTGSATAIIGVIEAIRAYFK